MQGVPPLAHASQYYTILSLQTPFNYVHYVSPHKVQLRRSDDTEYSPEQV